MRAIVIIMPTNEIEGTPSSIGKELRDLSFFALMALKLPERMVYYGTRDEKLCEIFADLFLGVTPGGLGKRKPITRAIFDAIRYPYFGLG